MPGAPAFFAAVGAFLAPGTLAATATIFVATTALSYGLARLTAPRIPKQGFQRDVAIRSGTEPKRVIYGEAATAGVVAYTNTRLSSGSQDNHDLHLLLVLAAHECEEIGASVWFDDDRLDDGTHLSWASNVTEVVAGTYDPSPADAAVKMWRQPGTSTQADLSELTSAYADWTTAHRGRGLAQLLIRFRAFSGSTELFQGGPPQNIRVLVKGKKDIYDPRLDTSPGANPTTATYQAWTDNPALICADYMTTYMGIDHARIDYTTVVSAANVCDELVDIPPGPSTTEKRYRCDGVLGLGDKHIDNIRAIVASMGGRLPTKVNGQYRIHAATSVASTVSIDADYLAGEPAVRSSVPRRERVNSMRATYFDEAREYREVEAQPVSIAAFVARDNNETIWQDAAYQMVSREYQTQRLRWLRLQLADRQIQLTLPMNWRGLSLSVGDVCDVTLDPWSWSAKTFRVEQIDFDPHGDVPVRAQLREDDAAAYTEPSRSDYTTAASPTPLVVGAFLPGQPSGLAAAAVGDFIRVTWSQPSRLHAFDEIVVHRNTSNSFAGATTVARIRGTEYLDRNVTVGTTYYYWVTAILGETQTSEVGSVSATVGAPRAVSCLPQETMWESYDGGSTYDPSGTTIDLTATFKVEGVAVGTRTLRGTRSGANVSITAVSTTGDATTYAVTDDATPHAYATVTHTASGTQCVLDWRVVTLDLSEAGSGGSPGK